MNNYKAHTGFLLFVYSALAGAFLIAIILNRFIPALASGVKSMCSQINTLISPSSSAILIMAAAGVILFIGIVSLFIQLVKTYMLKKRLLSNQISFSKKLDDVVVKFGLLDKVFLVKDSNLYSFCTGIFSSRIFISTGLVNSLANNELEAVILHEKAHLQNKDPLKVILGKTVSSAFFFLPIFSEIHKHLLATSEIIADNFAVSYQSSPAYLKTAISKILKTPNRNNYSLVAPIADVTYLEIRINKIINPNHAHHFNASLKAILTTFFFILLSIALLKTPTKASSDSLVPDPSSMCSIQYECYDNCSTPSYAPISPEHTF